MISVNHLSFAYKNSPLIFDDFSLHVEKGALFGLLGPNGAGKTSLISLIASLYTPTKGEIKVAGKRIASNRDQILKTISFVPQEYAFYEQLTASENLNFFAKLYPQNNNAATIAKQVNDAIELTGIGDYKNRKASTFSGGLKRRLNLAIGLLNKPQLLILDEPTVGIDPQSRHFILQAIQNLNAQGTTILYTSHYMTEIEQLCNDIAIIDHGKILRQGNLQDLLGTSTAIELTLSCSLTALDIPADTQSYFTKHGFAFDGAKLRSDNFSAQELPALLSAIEPLKQTDVAIEQIKYGAKTLEDVFFELTKTDLRD